MINMSTKIIFTAQESAPRASGCVFEKFPAAVIQSPVKLVKYFAFDDSSAARLHVACVSGCVSGDRAGRSSAQCESRGSYDSASRMSWLDTGQAPAVCEGLLQ